MVEARTGRRSNIWTKRGETVMPEQEQRSPEAKAEFSRKTGIISGNLAELIQSLAVQMAPLESSSDEEVNDFLVAVQIALGEHFLATILCLNNKMYLSCNECVEGEACLNCTSHAILDQVLKLSGNRIIAATTSPLASVH